MPEELDQLLSTLEGYWAIVYRRRWWILLPTLITWGIVWGISWLLPSTFQSEAVILLEQPDVPNQYVTPNVNASVEDRLQTIQQQVMSRTRLQAIIDRYHLYPEPHGLRVLIESGDPIEKMRKDISIEMVAAPGRADQFTAFKMHYIAKTPKLAQQVNADLVAPFVDENIETREQLSEDTTSFFENQLADARKGMEEQEAKLAAFKAKHPGASQGQLEMNFQQILTGLQSQLQTSHQAVEAARQQKMLLETQLQQAEAARVTSTAASAIGAAGATPDSATLAKQLERELVDLRLRLQELEQKYTADYPDVVALKELIAKRERLKKMAEEDAAASPMGRRAAGAADASGGERAQTGASTALMQLESQLKANQLEIENGQKRETELESQISMYLARLNTSPETEQELAHISRDYDDAKANYNSLLQKQMQSQLATKLEERRKGDQFRILDPPSFPKRHLAPNRFKFSSGGVGAGLALGLVIMAVLELFDIRIRQEKDAKSLVPALMLVSIPRLNTSKEDHARAVARWLDLTAVTLVLAALAAGNCYAFFRR